MGNLRANDYRDLALFLLRVGIGVGLALLHGQSKLNAAVSHLFQGAEWKFIDSVASLGFPAPTFFAIAAALSESIAAYLVLFGFATRAATPFIGFTMVVAIYRHLSAGQGAELPALYLLGAIVIGIGGPGIYSFDEYFRTRRQTPVLSANGPAEQLQNS